MNKYYIFCNGKILLKNSGTELPDTLSDKELESLFKMSGNIDKDFSESDKWAEVDSESDLPDKYVLMERRAI